MYRSESAPATKTFARNACLSYTHTHTCTRRIRRRVDEIEEGGGPEGKESVVIQCWLSSEF